MTPIVASDKCRQKRQLGIHVSLRHAEWGDGSEAPTGCVPLHAKVCDGHGQHNTASPISGDVECLIKALKWRMQFVVAFSKLPELRAIAGELFVGDITVETESDPEIENCQYIVFNVSAPEREASARRREWHARTHGVLRRCSGKVRLSISAE